MAFRVILKVWVELIFRCFLSLDSVGFLNGFWIGFCVLDILVLRFCVGEGWVRGVFYFRIRVLRLYVWRFFESIFYCEFRVL